MSARVLIFEGYDGAGKSTLLKNLVKKLRQNGYSYLVIDKETNPRINYLTAKLENTDGNPDEEIDLYIKRETEKVRIMQLNAEHYDFIIFNRSVLSALACAVYYNKLNEYKELIASLAEKIGKCTLIFFNIPFETAWHRTERKYYKTKKAMLGKEINQKMYDALLFSYDQTPFLKEMTKIQINTSRMSIRECGSELISILGAYYSPPMSEEEEKPF